MMCLCACIIMHCSVAGFCLPLMIKSPLSLSLSLSFSLSLSLSLQSLLLCSHSLWFAGVLAVYNSIHHGA